MHNHADTSGLCHSRADVHAEGESPRPAAADVDVPVRMIRPHLRDIPQAAMPDGYSIRPMRREDVALWTDVQRDAEPIVKIDDGLFWREFGDDPAAVERRCFLVYDPRGLAVGTVSAWYTRDFRGQEWGRIHWVATRPAHRGKGVARAALTHAMNCLAQWHQRAWLATSSTRLPAIRIYLDYGFVPDIQSDADAAAWRQIRLRLDDTSRPPPKRSGAPCGERGPASPPPMERGSTVLRAARRGQGMTDQASRRIFDEELDGFLPGKILDFHVHLMNPGVIPAGKSFSCGGHAISSYTLEDLRQDMADALPGREFSAVCFGFPDPSYDRQSNNDYAASCDDGRSFFALRLFDPRGDTPESLNADLAAGKFRGLKPYPDCARTADIRGAEIAHMLPPWAMEVADAASAIIMLHIPRPGRLADPLNQRQIIDYARRYPRARLVLAHVGRAYFLKNAVGYLEPLADLPNVYFDLSMVGQWEVIEHLFKTIPAHRILHGSDIPIALAPGKSVEINDQYTYVTPVPWSLSVCAAERKIVFTSFLYEGLRAIRKAVMRLGLDRRFVEGIFHDNGRSLLGARS